MERDLTVGIRPEQWSVGPADAPPGGDGVPAQIDVVEELGSDAFLYGHLSDGNGAGSTTIVVRTGGRSGARRGEMITLAPSSDDVHLFHPESGARL